MSDNLRDRIAAAIDQKYNAEAIGHTYEVCLDAADAVIAAVKLKRVNRYGFHRWVTEWEADDES